MKTSELTGAALNWAVAKAEGYRLDLAPEGSYTPSTNWAQGGPIMEREWIQTAYYSEGLGWAALRKDGGHGQFGPTPLTAAMRCYVASKLGDDVDVPEELK